MILLAAAHVVVDKVSGVPAEHGLFGWNEPTWVAAGAFAAAFAGIATAVMAVFTWQLATRTQKLAEETGTLAAETRDLVKASTGQFEQAERHHQEGLMPIVFIKATCEMEALGETGFMRVRMIAEIANVGPGAATEVEVIFKPIIFSGWRMYLGILGPNSRQPFEREWRVQTNNHINLVPHESLTLYHSVFGTAGATEQASGSGRADDTRVQWAINPGPRSGGLIDARIKEKFANAQRV